MKQTIFCNHYRAMSKHTTCGAGVDYARFQGIPYDDRPCFARRGNPAPAGCDLAVFPTAEELAAEEARMRQRMENIGKARQAIVAACGGVWKKGIPTMRGTINCPVCGGEGMLGFNRSGYNGHIQATCSTQGCVGWME
jgi:hypothetical protein